MSFEQAWDGQPGICFDWLATNWQSARTGPVPWLCANCCPTQTDQHKLTNTNWPTLQPLMTIVTTNPSHTSMLLQCSSPIPLTYKSIWLFRGAPRGLSAVANVQPTIADTQTGQTWETICESWWWLVLYSASALVSGHSLVMALLPLLSVFVELPMNSMQTCNSVTFYFMSELIFWY